MKEVNSTNSLGKEIETLVFLENAKIVAINVLVSTIQDSFDQTVSTECVELVTDIGQLSFYSLGCTQHWYGEYEIDVARGTNNEIRDLLSDSKKRGEKKIDLVGITNWSVLKGETIKEVIVYSAGHKTFNLLKLRNEKRYEQLHYIEFMNDEKVIFSIGYYGLNSNRKLNDYSWVGDLRINYKHKITTTELEKWGLKKIYKKS